MPFFSLQLFHVAYVLIKFANSPRPDLWVLERSIDFGQTYQPWQFFACEYTHTHSFILKDCVLLCLTCCCSGICALAISCDWTNTAHCSEQYFLCVMLTFLAQFTLSRLKDTEECSDKHGHAGIVLLLWFNCKCIDKVLLCTVTFPVPGSKSEK